MPIHLEWGKLEVKMEPVHNGFAYVQMLRCQVCP